MAAWGPLSGRSIWWRAMEGRKPLATLSDGPSGRVSCDSLTSFHACAVICPSRDAHELKPLGSPGLRTNRLNRSIRCRIVSPSQPHPVSLWRCPTQATGARITYEKTIPPDKAGSPNIPLFEGATSSLAARR